MSMHRIQNAPQFGDICCGCAAIASSRGQNEKPAARANPTAGQTFKLRIGRICPEQLVVIGALTVIDEVEALALLIRRRPEPDDRGDDEKDQR